MTGLACVKLLDSDKKRNITDIQSKDGDDLFLHRPHQTHISVTMTYPSQRRKSETDRNH